MADPKRSKGLYARPPMTYSTGTTVGEQTIAAATTAPTVVTEGFVVAGVDENSGDAQYAAPSFLELLVELSGSASASAAINFSVWFWMPDAATANKWRESAPFVASGPDVRGAAGADADDTQAGNVYKVDCPQKATRGFIHVETLAANINVHVLAYPDN